MYVRYLFHNQKQKILSVKKVLDIRIIGTTDIVVGMRGDDPFYKPSL